jgi:hypothetical protein
MDGPADLPLLPSSEDYSSPLNSRTLQVYLAFRRKFNLNDLASMIGGPILSSVTRELLIISAFRRIAPRYKIPRSACFLISAIHPGMTGEAALFVSPSQPVK